MTGTFQIIGWCLAPFFFINMIKSVGYVLSIMEVRSMSVNKGIIFILIGAACFGFPPVFAKLGFSYGYSLGQINIVQMVISIALLWSITLLKGLVFMEFI